MSLAYLSEEQNAHFDEDYHGPEELNEKIAYLASHYGDKSVNILDIGGGNGAFIDYILDRMPKASGTLLDISQLLIDRNAPHPRKVLVHGSADELDRLFRDRSFDVITINWVLHHLVGDDYQSSLDNVESLLTIVSRKLRPGGTIIVAENLFEGYIGTDLPSKIIFAITSQKRPYVRIFTKLFFNTAGIGVCFHSLRGWRSIITHANLYIEHQSFGPVWIDPFWRRSLYALLNVRQPRHGHFYVSAMESVEAGTLEGPI